MNVRFDSEGGYWLYDRFGDLAGYGWPSFSKPGKWFVAPTVEAVGFSHVIDDFGNLVGVSS